MTVSVSKQASGRRGQVRGVRELTGRIQAEVCLGSSTQHGYAAITIESSSPAAVKAMENLKKVLRDEAFELTKAIVEDDAKWSSGG